MATVLVVDDNHAIRTSVAELLRSSGYNVFEAGDAETALRLLAEHDVSVVVLDMRMPGGGGEAVLEALENPPPIIVTSGYPIDLDAESPLDTKIFVRLVKPFHPHRLLEAVSAAIGRPEGAPGIDN